MRTHNPILWGLASIVIGLLVMINPIGAIELLLQIIGIVLMAVGVMQLVSFLAVRKRIGLSWETFPLGGVLGLLFGLLLLVTPDTFAAFFMILVGAALIVLSIGQIVALSRVRKDVPQVPATGYLFPVLMGLSGFVFFFFPLATSAWIAVFAGAWVMAYGISEITAWFVVRYYKSKNESSDR